jgi:hypothetical protein
MKGPEKQTKQPMDAGVFMPGPCMPLSCLSEPMGGENAPRSLQNLWRLHQFGKPCTLDLSASQAGKNGEQQCNHDPRQNDAAQRRLEAEVAHAIHPHQHCYDRVRAHSAQGGPSPQAKPAKTAGKSCASGRCTADPWRDRCSGPAVRFA